MRHRSRHEAVVRIRSAAVAKASVDVMQSSRIAVHCGRTLERIDTALLQFSLEVGATPATVLAATLELAQRIAAAQSNAAKALERAKHEQFEAEKARAVSCKALDSALQFKRIAAGVEQRKRDARTVPIVGSAQP